MEKHEVEKVAPEAAKYGSVDYEKLRMETYDVIEKLGYASEGIVAVFKDLMEANRLRMKDMEDEANILPVSSFIKPFIDITRRGILEEKEAVRRLEVKFGEATEALEKLMGIDVFNAERVLASYELLHWADFLNRMLLYVHRNYPVTHAKVFESFGNVGRQKVEMAISCLLDSGSIYRLSGGDAGDVRYEVTEKGMEAVLKILGLARWNEAIVSELDRLNLLGFMGEGTDDVSPLYFLAVLTLLREAWLDGEKGVTASEVAYELGKRYGGQKRAETIEKVLEGMAGYGLAKAMRNEERVEYVLEHAAYYNPIAHAMKRR